jgi:hypothetical protein
MATVDSTEVFKARAIQLRITDSDVACLEVSKLDSFAKYAFCSTYQPGGSDERALRTVLEARPGRSARKI